MDIAFPFGCFCIIVYFVMTFATFLQGYLSNNYTDFYNLLYLGSSILGGIIIFGIIAYHLGRRDEYINRYENDYKKFLGK